jgi:hypothetical protein
MGKVVELNIRVPVVDLEDANFAQGIVEEALDEHYSIYEVTASELVELPDNK